MDQQKVANSVTPATAGHVGSIFSAFYNYLKLMDPRLREDDKKENISTFYGSFKLLLSSFF